MTSARSSDERASEVTRATEGVVAVAVAEGRRALTGPRGAGAANDDDNDDEALARTTRGSRPARSSAAAAFEAASGARLWWGAAATESAVATRVTR